jgi:hypothetical protein
MGCIRSVDHVPALGDHQKTASAPLILDSVLRRSGPAGRALRGGPDAAAASQGCFGYVRCARTFC